MSRDFDPIDAIDDPTIRHEESDVDIRAIFGFGAGLLIVAIVVLFAVRGLFVYFDEREARGTRAHPLATLDPRVPPEPRLQSAPREDLRVFRAREDAILNGYSWVNREAGVVRIPIAEAMKLIVERGLPVRQETGEPQK
jgi:hypothetical protein